MSHLLLELKEYLRTFGYVYYESFIFILLSFLGFPEACFDHVKGKPKFVSLSVRWTEIEFVQKINDWLPMSSGRELVFYKLNQSRKMLEMDVRTPADIDFKRGVLLIRNRYARGGIPGRGTPAVRTITTPVARTFETPSLLPTITTPVARTLETHSLLPTITTPVARTFGQRVL